MNSGKYPLIYKIKIPLFQKTECLVPTMATHSSILAWRAPWTEDPGRVQFMELQSQAQLKQVSSGSSVLCSVSWKVIGHMCHSVSKRILTQKEDSHSLPCPLTWKGKPLPVPLTSFSDLMPIKGCHWQLSWKIKLTEKRARESEKVRPEGGVRNLPL